tara:strand:+ start:289 stop:1332 length:1044 start_codon:yes stop_codon:yes gene_type:complete
MKLSYIFLLIIVLFFFYKPNENYTNYRKIIVKPNKLVYNPLLFLYTKSRINHFIYKTISKYIPSNKFKIKHNNKQIIKTVNLNKNILGLVTEYELLNFIQHNNNSNIRFICNLFYKEFSFISLKEVNINNLKKKRVGVMKHSSALYLLKKLQNIFKFKLIILDEFEIIEIKNILNKQKLDALGIFLSHPNNELEKLFKKNILNIFALDNVPKTILKTIVPYYKEASIEIVDYIKEKNYMIPTVKIFNIIITNKDTSIDISYNLLDNIYHKFIDIKLIKNDFLKRQTNYFNVNNIFSSENKIFRLHNGTYRYYIDKGYISYSDRNICRKYIGLQKCDENSRINPYRLL